MVPADFLVPRLCLYAGVFPDHLIGRRRRRRIIDRPLVPTTMPSMLHLSRVPEDNEHAMQLHRVASGSSKLTGNAGDIPQLPESSRGRLRRLARARRARGGSQRSIVPRVLLTTYYYYYYLLST